MKKFKRWLFAILAAMLSVAALAGCSADVSQTDQSYKDIDQNAQNRQPYVPQNDVEYNNYNAAQQLYDNPNTIIWCTTAWTNPSAPLVTVPIRGKLTSSSVSYYPNTRVDNDQGADYNPELRSVDGMYHGSPPPYRYGFTPGGQYVDFSNMEVFCTTSLTKFQREQTTISVTVDSTMDSAQAQAEQALANGDTQEAQRILEQEAGQ